jgi:plastocyanin
VSTRRATLWALPLLAGLALAGSVGSEARADVIKIKIDRLNYTPTTVTVKVGDKIEWTNSDFLAHTATDRAKAFDLNLPPGKTARLVISKAGTISYYCRYHPNMKGSIVAEAK